MINYVLIIFILIASELIYFRIADHLNIIDKPNERSSHSKVTLLGGGVIFYTSILVYFLLQGFNYPWFFIGFTLIAAISFADDVKQQSLLLRLFVQIASVVLLLQQLNLFSQPLYVFLIVLVVCIWILNAYNFMDGINGITGGYSFILMLTFWYLNTFVVQFVDNELIYTLFIALVIFLFFNFRTKAKCFAGDVGAISLAYIVVFILGLLILKTNDLSYIVLLAVYGVDSGLTIIHRLILKENIFKPHRKHLYQILANEMRFSHLTVSIIYMSIQLLVNIGFMFFDNKYIYSSIIILILSVTYYLLVRKHFHLHDNNDD